VAVHKSAARLLGADGALIGEGRAYLHLRLPASEPQRVQGTVSLDWWNEAVSTEGARLELTEGPTVALQVQADRLSECVVGRILRYSADWPGQV
jgi:hypothetical protein